MTSPLHFNNNEGKFIVSKNKKEEEIHIKINTESSSGDDVNKKKEQNKDTSENMEEQNIENDIEANNEEVEKGEEEISEKASVSSDIIDRPVEEKEIDYKDQLLRVQAEFINYRKRIIKEFDQIRIMTKIDFVKSLLPIIDNFESAIEHSKELNKDTDDIVSGFYIIYEQLKHILMKEGIEVLNPMGEYFDPNFHEAIAMIEDSEFEDGQIVIVNQKGYVYKDILVRPAKVIVAKKSDID